MKKLLPVAVALVALAAGSTAIAGSTNVAITGAGFTPQNVSVQSGDSVNWTNTDVVRHRVVFSNTSCSLVLDPGQSSACTFPAAGTFTYNDPNTGSAGTVNVAANTRAVTLAASRTIGIFGDSMTLSGTVSSKAAGEKVTVVAHPVGLPETRTDVTTTAGGNWSLLVQPRVKTTYQAVYDTATSASKTITLRPRLTFQKVGRHQYLVVVLASHSMAGKQIQIARWAAGRWLVFRTATIGSIARTSTTSVVYFTTVVRSGTKLRAFLPQDQAGSDYFAGHSNFVVQ
jgi:plastocyanin